MLDTGNNKIDHTLEHTRRSADSATDVRVPTVRSTMHESYYHYVRSPSRALCARAHVAIICSTRRAFPCAVLYPHSPRGHGPCTHGNGTQSYAWLVSRVCASKGRSRFGCPWALPRRRAPRGSMSNRPTRDPCDRSRPRNVSPASISDRKTALLACAPECGCTLTPSGHPSPSPICDGSC